MNFQNKLSQNNKETGKFSMKILALFVFVALISTFNITIARAQSYGTGTGWSYGSSSSYTPSTSSYGTGSGWNYGSSSSYKPSTSSYGTGSGWNYGSSSSYSTPSYNYGTGSGWNYGTGSSSNYNYGTGSGWKYGTGSSSNYNYGTGSGWKYGTGSSASSYAPSRSYVDSYLPTSSCSGSRCSGSSAAYNYSPARSYIDSYVPTTGCSGSGCGGNGGGMPIGGALGINYSDNDTIITDNSDNSVRIRNNIRNSSTTTNISCSNVGSASSTGNCNTNTINNYVASNDDDDNDDDDLEVICRVSDTSIEEGDTVTFEVEIDGGRSSYRIEWDGDISGDDEEEKVRFNRSGTYRVSVEVRDANGDRASDDCAAVKVKDEDDDEDDDDDDNRVTVTTGSNLNTPSGNLAGLESVFLSQVPYTGPSEVLKSLGILAVIAVWSAAVAMYFKKQRAVKAISNKIAEFKNKNKEANKIA